MKIIIERAALLKTLAHIQSVVERKNTIPILQNVLLDARGAGNGTLTLRATDMDMEVQDGAPCSVSAPGAITVSAHTLYDIARKLPDGAQVGLTASERGDQVTVTAGRSRFTLAALPVEDFPTFVGGGFSHTFLIGAEALSRLIDRSKFAISTEETRYYLNGIFLHLSENQDGPTLRAVATDGHRLARVECAAPEGSAGLPGIIIPRKTVTEIRKLLDDAEGQVKVEISDAKIRLTVGAVELCSKLIDGTYPDYQRVIPASNERVMTVNRETLLAAVDRVAAIMSGNSRAIKLECAADLITITGSSPETGTALEEVQSTLTGGFVEVGFNAKYLMEVAQQVAGDDVRFELGDSASPALVKDPSDGAALYVLMPMRV